MNNLRPPIQTRSSPARPDLGAFRTIRSLSGFIMGQTMLDVYLDGKEQSGLDDVVGQWQPGSDPSQCSQQLGRRALARPGIAYPIFG